jgi:hypothetical protein
LYYMLLRIFFEKSCNFFEPKYSQDLQLLVIIFDFMELFGVTC